MYKVMEYFFPLFVNKWFYRVYTISFAALCPEAPVVVERERERERELTLKSIFQHASQNPYSFWARINSFK
jgi:hypothetical protein